MSDSLVEKVQKAVDGACGFITEDAAQAAITTVLTELMEPSEEMYFAYGRALKDLIKSVPGELRVARWGRPRPQRGYKVKTREKVRTRHHAMLRAFAVENECAISAAVQSADAAKEVKAQ